MTKHRELIKDARARVLRLGRMDIESESEVLLWHIAAALETVMPRTVTTVEELGALPEGSILRSDEGYAFQRVCVGDSEGWDWMVIGSDEYRDWEEIEECIPATILYTPPK